MRTLNGMGKDETDLKMNNNNQPKKGGQVRILIERLVMYFFGTNLSVKCGMAGRILKGDTFDECARYGFYWWFWCPSFRSNGGNIKDREVLDINFHWLIFWLAVTSWPKKRSNT